MREIASFLIGLPGRKNLLWISGSFPATVLPINDVFAKDVGDSSHPNRISSSIIPLLTDYDRARNYTGATREATNALNESHTAVYPVDALGLQASGSYSAAIAPTTFQSNRVVAAGQVNRDHDEFAQRAAEEHTMDTIASDTGGHAFYNTNGLAAAASKALDDGSSYYALSYQPTNTKTDGKLRQIKVVCLKHGYTLEYRRSYFAESGPARNAAQPEAADPMLVALRRGAPPTRSLFFEAHLQTLGDPMPPTAQELDQLSQFQPRGSTPNHSAPAHATPVLMQHYAVTYGLLTRQLDLTPGPGNQRHAHLEFAAMAYDREGTLLNGTRTQIDDTISPARYDRL